MILSKKAENQNENCVLNRAYVSIDNVYKAETIVIDRSVQH